ncbi:SDR family NAD(P)-dependent oxidoreductase [Bowmanella dokdonensis]|uniref:SDR family oxidoreductase n=1 Tax=Bowmanella dokdonensis TaxID=751969 RepID=A0A939DR48_9ALTE|nr:SDR family oxidoreductase [Bowmanella dokdonensis]MBN7827138.1 SDR family oxidoreductase [Bowmanella dokdonensis]
MFGQFKDLVGARVFVTGGGSGIGAALVCAFVEQGARVAFVDIQADAAEQLLAHLQDKFGRSAHFQPCNIRNIQALQGCMGSAIREMGGLDVLINNAASDNRHDVSTLTPDEWDDSMNINLRPHFFASQTAFPHMSAQGNGSIINIGSNSALLGLTGYPAYVAAKSAILGLTKALARELGPEGIRVNTLVPGWVMTARQKQLWATPEAIAQCLSQQAIKDCINEQDIAEAALFLASKASRMLTGQAMVIDGGRV